MTLIVQFYSLVLLIVFFWQKCASMSIDMCNFTPSPGPSPSLDSLELENQFQSTVVAVIKQKNYSTEITEYFDYKANKAAIYGYGNGTEYVQLNDYEHQEGRILKDGKCQVHDLQQGNISRAFSFLTMDDDTNHVNSINDILKFGRNYNETYLGEDIVRGIPVHHWASCRNQPPFAFEAHFFMSQPGFETPSQSGILVRMEVNGYNTLSNEKFDNIYDFVTYKPGPVENWEVFEVPRGYVCEHIYSAPAQPTLPDMFTVHMEIIEPLKLSFQPFKQIYDNNWEISRTDFMPEKESDWMKQYGMNYLSIIQDFHTGIEYVMDTRYSNCSFRKIQMENGGSPIGAHEVFLREGPDIFDLPSKDLTFQGRRRVRGIDCDVWSGYTKNGSGVIEFYFAQEKWNNNFHQSRDRILIGIWEQEKSSSGDVIEEYDVCVHHYDTVKPDFREFGVQQCFSDPDKHLYARIQIPGQYAHIIAGGVYDTTLRLRETLAIAAKVRALRITDIFLDATTENYVDFWFTILDKVPDEMSNVHQITVEEAKENLVKQVDSVNGLTLSTHFEAFHFLKGSFLTDEEATDPRPTARSCEVKEGYSSGAMAGLAIIMVILGGALGATCYYLWKKRMEATAGTRYIRDPDL